MKISLASLTMQNSGNKRLRESMEKIILVTSTFRYILQLRLMVLNTTTSINNNYGINKHPF